MVFISSQLPLTELQDNPIDKIASMDWFLFSSVVKNKNYKQDNELNEMYNRLLFYPIFYGDKLYNYLMTDSYFYETNLYKTTVYSRKYICMNKIKRFEEIVDFNKEVFKQEERIFGEDDIKKMFDCFKRNNFRELSVCEYMLG